MTPTNIDHVASRVQRRTSTKRRENDSRSKERNDEEETHWFCEHQKNIDHKVASRSRVVVVVVVVGVVSSRPRVVVGFWVFFALHRSMRVVIVVVVQPYARILWVFCHLCWDTREKRHIFFVEKFSPKFYTKKRPHLTTFARTHHHQRLNKKA
mgnify:FL=1